MRWCFFSPGFRSVDVLSGDSRRSGGAEAQIAHLATALAEAGHDVSLIYGQGAGDAPPASIAGVRCMDAAPDWRRPRSLLDLWRALDAIAPDMIYARLPSDFLCILGLFARCRPGVSFVYALAHDSHCRAWSAWEHRRWFHAPLFALGMRSAHKIAVQHDGQADRVADWRGDRLIRVPNVVHGPAERPRSFEHAEIDVVWIAQIRPEKRLDRLLDLATRLPDLRFAVVGGFDPVMSDAERVLLQRRAAALMNVSMLGPRRAPEVRSILTRSRVLASTSDGEGFPNVMLEAWSVGVPVVSLTVDPGGIIAREEIGIVSASPERLREDVAALVENKLRNHHLGGRGLAYVRRHHRVEAALQALAGSLTPRDFVTVSS